jgi:hypothetical protein
MGSSASLQFQRRQIQSDNTDKARNCATAHTAQIAELVADHNGHAPEPPRGRIECRRDIRDVGGKGALGIRQDREIDRLSSRAAKKSSGLDGPTVDSEALTSAEPIRSRVGGPTRSVSRRRGQGFRCRALSLRPRFESTSGPFTGANDASRARPGLVRGATRRSHR